MDLAADLHIHSSLSPCGSLEMSPRAIVERALSLGLGMIAVTDHNAMENALHAAEYGERRGLCVVCGMEAQTSEDVHLLCLLPSAGAAADFYGEIYPCLPDVANDPEFFGDQAVVDGDDEILRFEPRLLLNGLRLSIADTVCLARRHGGFVIPAHVECQAHGLLATLGFLPDELRGCPLELSRGTSPEEALAAHPGLAGLRLIRNSDAHYLADLGRAYTVYRVDEASIGAVYRAAQDGRYETRSGGAS